MWYVSTVAVALHPATMSAHLGVMARLGSRMT
jgi:hypothetical protein